MKKGLFFIHFILLVCLVGGQTTIKDGQEVHGKWTKSGSPYIVEGEAIVPYGKTLTIGNEVEVQFKTGTDSDYLRSNGRKNKSFDLGYLRVLGTVVAKGKKNKAIVFTGTEKNGKWGNIVLYKSNGNVFEYCEFHNCQYMRDIVPDDNSTGALSFIESEGLVKNCVITNSWSGVNAKKGGTPKIINCTIIENEYGIESNSDSEIFVENTIVWNNANAFYINAGAKIKITYSLTQDKSVTEGLQPVEGMIFGTDPLLTSKYKLSDGSPCIKAGSKKANIGANF